VVGILRLKTRPRFIVTSQQLVELCKDIEKGKDQGGTTLLIDAALQTNASSKMTMLISYICQQSRRLNLHIVIVGSEGTRVDRRLEYCVTSKVKMEATPI
jgi:hypothetical protein